MIGLWNNEKHRLRVDTNRDLELVSALLWADVRQVAG